MRFSREKSMPIALPTWPWDFRRLIPHIFGFWKALFVLCYFISTSVPAVVHMARGTVSSTTGENRVLAPLPAPPKAIGELMRWPTLLEAYLRNSFPYRSELVSLNNRTRSFGLGDSPNREVVRGDTGRLFLGPPVSDFHYYSILTLCGVGVPEAWKQKVADRYSEAIARFTQKFNDAWVFIVPTSPTIYQDELPSWAAAQCKNTIPLVSKILERVPDKLRHHIVYPEEEIATLSRTAEVFPKLNFHLGGSWTTADCRDDGKKVPLQAKTSCGTRPRYSSSEI